MVVINQAFCKNCGYCVRFCPKKILEIGKTRNKRGHFYPVLTDESKCITCAICAQMCPEGAIDVTEGKKG